MNPRHAALPSPTLHPTIFQKLRFKLARANAIVYNACVWHRRHLSFITRIRGKRVLSGLPPLKKLSARQNSVMVQGVQIDRKSSESCNTPSELTRVVLQDQPVVDRLETTAPHIPDASKPGPSYSQGANEIVEQSRSYSPPPPPVPRAEQRRWEYSQAWLNGATEYQHKRREMKRKHGHGQQLHDYIYRFSAPSPSSPSPHHVLQIPEHARRPCRPSEYRHSAPAVRTYVKEHTSRLQTYRHKHPRTRSASRHFARQQPYRSSADSRVFYRAHRHTRSRTSSLGHSFAQSSRHALSSPVRRTPHNVRARSIASQSRDISVPYYATPPLSSVGRERWSGETAEVMQTSRRADARKRPLDECRVQSGDGIDAPGRKKFRATA